MPQRLRFAPGKSPFHVKGVVYRYFFEYLDHQLEGGRARLLAAIDEPDLRAFADQPFLAGTFYDTAPIMALCERAASLLGRPFLGFVREFAEQQAETDIKGIYRMLLRLVSPDLVMDRVPAAAKQYFDFVSTEVEKLGPKSYRSTAHGIPEPLMQFYMTVTEAFLSRALTLAGAKELVHRWLPPQPDGVREGVPLVVCSRELSWG
jgi:hypothetical protein